MNYKVLPVKNLARFLYFGIFFFCFGQLSHAQQTYVFSGTVKDASVSQPIIGATVIIGGTSIGTTSDFDGNYTLSASLKQGNYKLIFSYLGFSSQTVNLTLAGDTNISTNVSLSPDLMNLDEVIVTGNAGNTSRRQLGNSIGTIKAEEIANTGSGNPLSALSGKVLGAQVTQNSGDPAGGFSVTLRGTSTVFGSSDPLYIVDGVIVDNSSQNVINLNADAQGTGFQAGQNRLVDINPNDIERIEVLNGSSAAAIYGSLASNGVVQIFTKRGQPGKTRITLSNTTNLNYLRKRLEFNKFGGRFGFKGDDRLSTVGDRLTTIADLRPPADKALNPGTGPVALGGRLVENIYNVERFDYQDQIFRDAVGTENYISVGSGTEKSSYFFSASYNRNEGIVEDTHFQKYGVRFKMDQQLFKNLKLTAGGSYNNSSSEDKPNGNNFFSPVSTMIIIDNVWDITERDEFGNLLHVEQQRVNPLSVIEGFEIKQEINRFIGNTRLDFTPIEGLNLAYTFGLDSYSLVGNTFQPRLPYSPVASSFFPDGYVAVATANVFQTNSDFLVNYNKNIGDFSSTTTAGFQFLFEENKSTKAEGRDLLDFIKTLDAAQNFFTNPTEFRAKRTTWGYFLQETVGYKDLIYLTLAGRIDGSSVFSTSERSQFYPKVSSSFIASDLDFWKNGSLGKVLNTFKLRASYGEAGNLTAIGPFDRFTNATPVVLTGRGGFIPSTRLGVENIKPETNEEFEIGTDFSILNRRVGIEFSYYKQDVQDLILPVTLSPSSGGASTIANIGSLTNKGIELKVSATPINSVDFSWNTSVLFSTFDNELGGIGNGRSGILLRGGGGVQSAIDGRSLGTFFGTFFARNDDGSLLLSSLGLPQVERGNDVTGEAQRDGSGQPTGTPLRKALGDPNADYTLTWVNEFRYKKLSLRMQFDASQGQEVYNWNSITSNNVGNGKLAERELRGEVPRGWVAAIGGFIGPRIQEFHVEDGSFIKLRELSVNYDFGKWMFFENFNASVIGRNIFSLDNYTGFDPETNSAGQSSTVRGDDFGNVPIPTTIQVKFTFSL